ncbi:MAG: hypothetical protein HAW62_05840 [Endozoicomonadaceae bacterium]|nr:hypothetical protein [Endozoicomonadaceae bacterium]
MPLPTYSIQLICRETLAKDTLSLSFKVLDETPFIFKAGQFVSLHFEYKGQQYKRSYSLASSVKTYHQTHTLEIAMKCLPAGRASEYFQTVPLNTQFILQGPAGVLVLPDVLPQRLVFVGTGTGVAPYRAMLPELSPWLQAGGQLNILMGIRHRVDLFYDLAFREICDVFDRADFELFFSQESVINQDQGEYIGYVQQRFESLALNPNNTIIYLCGSPPMIDDSLLWLKANGFTSKSIRREKYTFSR